MNRKILLILLIVSPGCRKFVTVDAPITQLSTATVYTSDATAEAAVTGIYSQIMNNASDFASGGATSISFLAGLSADEFINYSTSQDMIGFYSNSILPGNGNLTGSLWGPAYQYIYDANLILEGLASSNGVSAAAKKELTGEALFVRSFCYFYLVNLFGDVPLILGTDYKSNEIASRTPTSTIYQQIISDLQQAQAMLPADYSFANGQKVRPNKWAATALLARVYLYLQDWADAQSSATAILNSGSFSLAGDMDSVFLANSKEAIWQLMPVSPGYNTWDAYFFILTTTPENVSVSPDLLNAFELGDLRRSNWIDSVIVSGQIYYYPFKYKINGSGNPPVTEYSMVLRLAEQYLIRAEAEAEQDDIPDATADINIIRSRAGLSATTANDKPSLLTAIEHEREIELFSEWGHRWLDLKRTGLASTVLPLAKPLWQNTDTLYPIPESEIKS